MDNMVAFPLCQVDSLKVDNHNNEGVIPVSFGLIFEFYGINHKLIRIYAKEDEIAEIIKTYKEGSIHVCKTLGTDFLMIKIGNINVLTKNEVKSHLQALTAIYFIFTMVFLLKASLYFSPVENKQARDEIGKVKVN